jgi:hypothetical protein
MKAAEGRVAVGREVVVVAYVWHMRKIMICRICVSHISMINRWDPPGLSFSFPSWSNNVLLCAPPQVAHPLYDSFLFRLHQLCLASSPQSSCAGLGLGLGLEGSPFAGDLRRGVGWGCR